MSKAANKSRLEALHDALATEMARILKDGEVAVDKETGEAVRTTPAAATLNAIRQFLKDNNIEAPHDGTPAINSLRDAVTRLPFGEDPRDLAK